MRIPTECTLPGGNKRQFLCGNSAIAWFAWTSKYGGEKFSCLCEQHKDVKLPLAISAVFNSYDDAVAYRAMMYL